MLIFFCIQLSLIGCLNLLWIFMKLAHNCTHNMCSFILEHNLQDGWIGMTPINFFYQVFHKKNLVNCVQSRGRCQKGTPIVQISSPTVFKIDFLLQINGTYITDELITWILRIINNWCKIYQLLNLIVI